MTVSDVDYDYLNQWKWYLTNTGYAARSEHFYKNGKRSCRTILMHRVILERDNNIDSKDVDHKNQNRLDNTRENLRACSHAQNCSNVKLYRNNSTGYKGVYKIGNSNRPWMAMITSEKQRINLGRFSNALDAAKAYNQEAIVRLGEFARLNKVEV